MRAVLIVVLIAAAVTTGLATGLLWGWAVSVMPGLRRVTDPVFVEFLQHTNRAILNGWFLSCFTGAVVLDALAAVLAIADGRPGLIVPAVLALVLYLATVGITQLRNIPLNNRMDAATADDASAVRRAFEAPWTRWNIVRSLTGIGSMIALGWALVVV
jgi:uncharacterized membrane protein